MGGTGAAHWWVELGLVSLVDRAVSRGVFRGGYGLRKTLSSLSADGSGCVPALWVVWPEASHHWSLQAVGWAQVLASKWQPPGQLTPMITQYLCHQCPCPCPHSEAQPPPPSQETLQDQQVGLAQAPLQSLLFPLGPGVHETLCAHSKSGISVSPSPVEFL